MQMETFGLRAAYALVFGLSEAGLQVPGKPQEYEKAQKHKKTSLGVSVRLRHLSGALCIWTILEHVVRRAAPLAAPGEVVPRRGRR